MAATTSTCADFLRVLHPLGAWYEIRALKCRPGGGKTFTANGYFDSPVEAGAAAEECDGKLNPAGVYVTINPVNPACSARSHKRIKKYAEQATGADEITCRRWLPLDIDSHRPPGVSATVGEATAATTLARRISAELGWPEPIRCMTGNGALLLYRIDLPNDKESEALVRDVLAGLAARFDTSEAHIDRGIWDAPRIVKVMGTMARKGDNTPDRPHRRSAFKAPATLEVVTREQLLEVEKPSTSSAAQAETSPRRSNLIVSETVGKTWERIESTAVSVRSYLERHGVVVKAEREKGGTIILDLESCPITGANGGSSVSVLIGSDGKISYPNRHNRGVGLTWFDLRDHLEPGYKAWAASVGEYAPDAPQSPVVVTQPAAAPQAGSVKTISVGDLLDMDIKPVRWIIPGIIPEGLTVLVGNPKIGKSTFLLSAVLDLAGGHPVFGSIEADPVQTLYLSLEDNARRIRERVIQMNRGRKRPGGLVFITGDSGLGRLGSGAEAEIERYLDAHPDVRLVVIDTWIKVKPWKTARSNATEYDADSAAWGILHEISTRRRISIVVVHHTRKAVIMGGDWTQEISGSQGITGIVDTILLIRRVRGENTATLHVAGREHDEEKEIRFTGHKETKTWSISGEQSENFTTGTVTGTDAVKVDSRLATIIDYLKFAGPTWPKYIAEGIGLENSKNIRTQLFRLWQRGIIGKDERDRYYIKDTFANDGPGGPVGPVGPDATYPPLPVPVVPFVPVANSGLLSIPLSSSISTTERENKEEKEGAAQTAENPPPLDPPSATAVGAASQSQDESLPTVVLPPPPQMIPAHLVGGWSVSLGAYNTSADNIRKDYVALTSGRVSSDDYDRRARKYLIDHQRISEFRKSIIVTEVNP